MARSAGSEAGWKIPGYTAECLIGCGASAQVWRARTTRTGEPVALKVLETSDQSTYRAARAEAALLSALDHPHLLRLHELVADRDQAILVLDLAEGGSLADVLERRSRITAGEAVTTLSPIAAALAYAHEQGLMHGDVSPANILFTEHGQPLLADLGVARLFGDFDDVRSTLAYLDPAVAAGGPAGTASDVFMIAAVALHALTGRPPWTGSSAGELIDCAAGGEIAALDELLSDVPRPVAAVVTRGLSAVPHARGTAAEFALDLRHAAVPAAMDLGAGRARRAAEHGYQRGREQPSGAAQARSGATAMRSADSVRSMNLAPSHPPRSAGSPRSARYSPRHCGATPVVVDGAVGGSSKWIERVDPEGAASTVDRDCSSVVELDRPEFARPVPVEPGAPAPFTRAAVQAADNDIAADASEGAGALSLTHQVRARARIVVPPGRWEGRRRPVLLAAGAVVACVVLATVAVAWAMTGWPRNTSAAVPPRVPRLSRVRRATGAYPADGGRSSTSAIASSTSGPITDPAGSQRSGAGATSTVSMPSATLPSVSMPSATLPSVSLPSVSRASPPPLPATSPAAVDRTPSQPAPSSPSLMTWTATLSELDTHRERAFAAGDPRELSEVYLEGSLLDQDVQALRRVVPAGCALTGLRTSYRVLQARTLDASTVDVAAHASLSPAVLRCGGTVRQRSAPRTADNMHIRLVLTRDGYRISALSISDIA